MLPQSEDSLFSSLVEELAIGVGAGGVDHVVTFLEQSTRADRLT